MIIKASDQVCGPVGGVYNNYSHIYTNSTTCTAPSGTQYYPVPSSATLRGQRISVAVSFATAHDIFNLTNLNTSDPESVILNACLVQCDTFGQKCSSFFVNLGIPYPPLPSGQNQASRWYCHGYDAPLSPADFALATVPETYISPEAFNRACNRSMAPIPTPTGPSNGTPTTEAPSVFTGQAAGVERNVFYMAALIAVVGAFLA